MSCNERSFHSGGSRSQSHEKSSTSADDESKGIVDSDRELEDSERLPSLQIQQASDDESSIESDIESEEESEEESGDEWGVPQVYIDFEGMEEFRWRSGIGDLGDHTRLREGEERVKQRQREETKTWRGHGVEVESILSSLGKGDQDGSKQNRNAFRIGGRNSDQDDEESIECSLSESSFENIDEESMESSSHTKEGDKEAETEEEFEVTQPIIRNLGRKVKQSKLPSWYQKIQGKSRQRKNKKKSGEKTQLLERTGNKLRQQSLAQMWGWKGGKDTDKVGERCGDDLQPNSKGSLVCYLQNANSITARMYDSSLRMMVENMHECNIGIGMFPETNTNWENRGLSKQIFSTMRDPLDHSKIITSQCGLVGDKKKYSRRYLPGGTLTIATNKWSSRVCGSGKDELGRWSWVTLQGKGGTKIYMITGYKVGKKGSGDLKFYSQLKSKHIERGNTGKDPWVLWTEDFQKFITEIKDQGGEIILGIDVNEYLDKEGERKSFIKMCVDTELMDIFKWKHPEVTPLESVSGGKERIDGFFCTENILPAVKGIMQLGRERGLFSDHRPMVVEFDEKVLFEKDEERQHKKRILKSGNDNSVRRYTDELTAQCLNYKLGEKIDELVDRMEEDGATEDNVKMYNKIDKMMEEGMKCAEKKCAVSNPKKYEFSRALDEAGWAVRYWKGRLVNPYRRKAPSEEQLKLWATRGRVEYKEDENIDEVKEKHREARKKLRTIHKNAKQARRDFQWEQAMEKYHNNEEEARAAILAMRRKEKSNEQHKNVKTVVKGARQPLEYILVQDGESLKRVDKRDELEETIMKQNTKQLNQAQPTPFGHGIGREMIDENNVDNKIKEALEGKLPTDWMGDDEIGKAWVKELQCPFEEEVKKSLNEKIGAPISEDEFVTYWKGLPEKTVSSPSGLHVGHYKTIIKNEFLRSMWVQMVSLPAQYGFAPERWKQSLHCMLEKDAGRPRINRLRIVQLVEADLNFVLKRIWGYRLSRAAEREEVLEDSQMGGRIRRMSISAVLRKILQYDSLRLAKKSGAVLDNDAIGCFDRIIPSLASITCMRLGLPAEAASMLYKVLNGMSHKICTGFGVSLDFISSIHTMPLFGTGQGSGASPFIWITTCEINLRVLRSKGYKVLFVSPNGDIKLHRPCDAFVDDTALTVVGDATDPKIAEEEVVRKITKNGQIYERSLWTSGGALALHKCAWFLLIATWTGTEMTWKRNKNKSRELKLRSGDDSELHTIKQKDPDEALLQLGVWAAPLGQMKTQTTALVGKTKHWAGRVRSSRLTPTEVDISFRCGIQMSVRYPLPVTRMNEEQCRQVDTPMITALLHAHGTTSRFPRDVLFGHTRYGGLGYGSTAMHQLTEGITLMLGHLRLGDTTGQLGEIVLQQIQLEVGTSLFFFEMDPEIWGTYGTPALVAFWWQQLRKHRIHLQGQKSWIPRAAQVDELSIMDIVVPHFGKEELKKINAVRLYLNAYYPSDIVEVRGYKVIKTAREGRPLDQRGVSKCEYPRQKKPTKSWLDVWEKAMDVVESENKVMELDWSDEEPNWQWKWWTNRLRNKLYSVENEIREYDEGRRARKFNLRKYSVLHEKPPGLIRCDIRDSWWTAEIIQVAKVGIPNPQKVYLSHLKEIISRIPKELRRIIGKVYGTIYGVKRCLEAARTGELIGGSDGSVLGRRATHGWALCPGSLEIYVNGMGPVDGKDCTLTSYRAELWGELALVMATEVFAEAYNGEGKGTMYIDNSSVVGSTRTQEDFFSVRDATKEEAELIKEIYSWMKRGRIKWEVKWVKSHQEEPNTLEGRMNQLVDNLTGHAYNLSGEWVTKEKVEPLPSIGWNLMLQRSAAGGKVRDTVMEYLQEERSISYILNKEGWSIEQLEKVNWEGIRRSNHGRSFGVRLTRAKLMNRWLPTKEYQVKRGYGQCNKCPCCQVAVESWEHVFRCRDVRAKENRRLQLRALREGLFSIPTPSGVVKAIFRGLVIWTSGNERAQTQMTGWDEKIQTAVRSQTDLGWENIIKGRLVNEWLDAVGCTSDPGLDKRVDVPKDKNVWGQRATSLCLAYGINIWKFRNKVVHGLTPEEERKIHRRNVIKMVKKVYRRRPKIRTSDDSRLFGVPVALKIGSTTEALEAWLCHVKAAKRSYKRFGEVGGQNKKQTPISEWMRGNIVGDQLAPEAAS